jgi:hypothetical protein
MRRGIHAAVLLSKIDEGLKKWNDGRQAVRYADASKKGIHVSDLLGNNFCVRQAWYKHTEGVKGALEIHSPQRLRTYFQGVMVEEMLKLLLRMAGVPMFRRAQKRLVGVIIGTPDIFLRLWNHRWVVECKSLHMQAYRALNEPTRDYLRQTILYQWLYKVKRGFIAVYGKGADEWKVWEIHKEDHPDVLLEMVARASAVYAAVKQSTPPQRIADADMKKHKKCKKCQFVNLCFVRDKEVN